MDIIAGDFRNKTEIEYEFTAMIEDAILYATLNNMEYTSITSYLSLRANQINREIWDTENGD